MDIGQIKETINLHKMLSARNSERRFYRVNRSNAALYFDCFDKWESRIRNYFKELHNAGERVVHVDICGCATGERLHADISYCFSISVDEFTRRLNPDNVFIEGDLFNSNHFSKLLEKLSNDPPALVTFEPIVGLQDYYQKPKEIPEYMNITYSILEKRLTDMIHVLRPGGHIYIAEPFRQGTIRDFILGKRQNEYEISMHLKRIARRQKCRIEIRSDIHGPHFLMQKRQSPCEDIRIR